VCTSNSIATKIECLIRQESFIKARTPIEKPADVLSKTKPDIDQNITKVDLNSWYSIDDLRNWVREHDLIASGTKKDLIERVLAFFGRSPSGKLLTGKQRERLDRKSQRSQRPLKKQRTDFLSISVAPTEAPTEEALPPMHDEPPVVMMDESYEPAQKGHSELEEHERKVEYEPRPENPHIFDHIDPPHSLFQSNGEPTAPQPQSPPHPVLQLAPILTDIGDDELPIEWS